MDSQRTIQTILSLETGDQIEADSLFENHQERESEIFQLRTKIEEQIQKGIKDYVCLYCKQPVAIRGRKNLRFHTTHFYFTHPYKSNDCIIKSDSKLTEEDVRCIKYNGVKESRLHDLLKREIAHYLEFDKTATVTVDKVYRDSAISKKWRKPDVLAILPDMKIAFELQLSTTFLSVIVGRTIFYKERGIFLIWVFPEFSLENDLQKFTQKDVYYNNNFNVYVFDQEARNRSKDENTLVLRCYYKEYSVIHDRLHEEWIEDKFIKISDLTFDFENIDACFYDSTNEKARYLNQIEEKEKERLNNKKRQITKAKVDKALFVMREFYKNDFLHNYQKNFLNTIETTEEIIELNKELGFSEKASFISKLFFDRKKSIFLSFIFEQDKIFIDTSKLIYNDKSVLEELMTLSSYDFKKYTSLLFRKGYILTNHDNTLLEYLSKDTLSKESIAKWAFIYLLSVSKKEFATNIRRIDEKILNALLSLKKGYVIGSELNNLRQISNNFFEYRRPYGDIYIKAMKIYNQYDKLLNEDKKGKLKTKIDSYLIENPTQDNQYDEIIYEIFPELI